MSHLETLQGIFNTHLYGQKTFSARLSFLAPITDLAIFAKAKKENKLVSCWLCVFFEWHDPLARFAKNRYRATRLDWDTHLCTIFFGPWFGRIRSMGILTPNEVQYWIKTFWPFYSPPLSLIKIISRFEPTIFSLYKYLLYLVSSRPICTLHKVGS